MKKIIIDNVSSEKILLDNISEYTPVFAKKPGNDDLCGMMVKEKAGWILRIGGEGGATGYHSSLRACIESCSVHDYEFFVS